MKKLFTILMLCIMVFSGSVAQERQFRPFIEEGKTWRYKMSDSYARWLTHTYELRLEGKEMLNGKEYTICNEYLDGVNLSEKIGPYGYFREEENGDLFYRGNAVGRIDFMPNNGWKSLSDDKSNYQTLSAEDAAQMEDILVYSYEKGVLIQLANLPLSDVDNPLSLDDYEVFDFVGKDYLSPSGEKLKVYGFISEYLNQFCPLIIESVGYIYGTLVDCSRVDRTILYGEPFLQEVVDAEGCVLYRNGEPYERIGQYTHFLKTDKTWKYICKNHLNDKDWEETVELRISDWDYLVGCRYACYLYRDGSDAPEQNTPWCYLWEGKGQLSAHWNEYFSYRNPDNHKNKGAWSEYVVADLSMTRYSETLFDNDPQDFKLIDYTGADGKKYICYQNSEGTRLIEGVGFVFEDRPASLVGPIDDTAEEYTDRWYLYSVVDADGTEIYSDPRYRPGSGVFSVTTDDAPTEYYNLQGVRVTNPTTGLYIVRQGEKAVVKFLK